MRTRRSGVDGARQSDAPFAVCRMPMISNVHCIVLVEEGEQEAVPASELARAVPIPIVGDGCVSVDAGAGNVVDGTASLAADAGLNAFRQVRHFVVIPDLE